MQFIINSPMNFLNNSTPEEIKNKTHLTRNKIKAVVSLIFHLFLFVRMESKIAALATSISLAGANKVISYINSKPAAKEGNEGGSVADSGSSSVDGLERKDG